MKLTMLLLCAGSLMAQCPVEITDIGTAPMMARRQVNLEDPQGPLTIPIRLDVKVKNLSGKEIQAVRLRAWWADRLEEFRVVTANMDTESIKVGKERKVGYQLPQYETGTAGWLVVPVKVLFSDGTKWENEEGDCFGQRWWKKEHPPLKELPTTVKGSGR
jgi:hypothetical protein